jgi:Transcriptional regulator
MNNPKNSKDYITEALLQLMIKKKFKDITITDIANKAGVNRITIYRNFDSKEEIIKNYLKVIFDDWNVQWDRNNKNVAYQIFSFFAEYQKIIDLLYKSDLQLYMIDHILLMHDYKADDPNIVAYAKVTLAYLIFGWCNEWYKRGMIDTPEEMSELFEQNKKQ